MPSIFKQSNLPFSLHNTIYDFTPNPCRKFAILSNKCLLSNTFFWKILKTGINHNPLPVSLILIKKLPSPKIKPNMNSILSGLLFSV